MPFSYESSVFVRILHLKKGIFSIAILGCSFIQDTAYFTAVESDGLKYDSFVHVYLFSRKELNEYKKPVVKSQVRTELNE